jgi:hypothetical protein
MPKQQAATAEKLVKRIEEAIPFETIDVVRAANQRGRPTIGQRTTEVVQGGMAKSFNTEAEAQAARDRGEIKAGDSIMIDGRRGTWRD